MIFVVDRSYPCLRVFVDKNVYNPAYPVHFV